MKESEKVTEKYLVKQMGLVGGQCYKWVAPGYRGVPDRICIFPSGAIKFVELKSEGIKPSQHQRRFAKRLTKCNTEVTFIDTKAQVDLLVELRK